MTAAQLYRLAETNADAAGYVARTNAALARAFAHTGSDSRAYALAMSSVLIPPAGRRIDAGSAATWTDVADVVMAQVVADGASP
jgi:hypothetical protein